LSRTADLQHSKPKARFGPKTGRFPLQKGEVAFYRTFSVASPIIARMSEMIQKRITMVLSAQPFFS
jgi:hypothetical protein